MGEDRGPLTHTWPSGNEESFTRSRSYSIRDGDRELAAASLTKVEQAFEKLEIIQFEDHDPEAQDRELGFA